MAMTTKNSFHSTTDGIVVEPAERDSLTWATEQVISHHYLRKSPDRRSRPLGYVVRLDGERVADICALGGMV